MANMSYCRFRNTAADLADVVEVWADDEDLSRDELVAKRRILQMAADILAAEGIDYDDEALDAEVKRLRALAKAGA